MSALSSHPSMSRIASTTSSISTMPLQPHSKQASDRRRARAASNTSRPLDPIAESTHKHTWIIPGAIAAALFLLFLVFGGDDESNPFRALVLLSYPILQADGSVVYGKGRKDLMFCGFYTAVFTFIREFSMEMVLRPLARWLELSKSKQSRFMEQCYALVYFIAFGLFGLVTSLTLSFLFLRELMWDSM